MIINIAISSNRRFLPVTYSNIVEGLLSAGIETDLYNRIRKAGIFPYLCTDAFIFHYKAKTVGVYGKVDRDRLDF